MHSENATPKTMRGRADFMAEADGPEVREITMAEFLAVRNAGLSLVPLAYEDRMAEVVTVRDATP